VELNFFSFFTQIFFVFTLMNVFDFIYVLLECFTQIWVKICLFFLSNFVFLTIAFEPETLDGQSKG